MTLATVPDVRFNPVWGEASWVLQAGTFTGLSAADRQILSDWLDRADAGRIDTVMDLAVRPWNIAGAQVIVGVFEKGRQRASWLIVRHHAGWMLARCADGSVSDVSIALPDILALIDEALRA
ncbi:MAG: hypothetical protein P4L90_27265 [Rhodopila sp.]|nr:hypothetical protein [Rhodopila sp.]